MSRSGETVVGFDLRPLQECFKAHKHRGIGVYTRNLMAHRDVAPPSMHGVPFFDPSYESEEAQENGALSLQPGWMTDMVGPALSELVRQTVLLGSDLDRFAQKNEIDLFFFPSHLDVPAGLKTPYVATAHDMIYAAMMERFYRSFKQRISVKAQVKALQNAECIIAVSAHTKKDVIIHAGVDANKIKVVHNGVSEAFRPGVTTGGGRLTLPEKFILNVGGIDWRKNIDLLFTSFNRLLEIDPDLHLVMTGDIEGDNRYQSFITELHKSGLHHRVITPGFVSEEELVLLYNRCLLFCYPSLYEGFGLPLLEAMACGAPVVTTNRSSIPEVVGDAALTLDPDSPKDFQAALIALVQSSSQRQELSEAGILRATQFSWHRCATETYKLLDF